MTLPRAQQVDVEATPYYHCMTRCVRRSYLCGKDEVTGQDYSYRKGLMVNRLKGLSEIFAVRICAYAIMSNHYHLVLYVDKALAQSWDSSEIQRRWKSLYGQDGVKLEVLLGLGVDISSRIETLRERLSDLSWFMRAMNEWVARVFNKEEGNSGRFWESRFKSQALLDEGAVLSAMAYVDLNPIRAKMAQSLEASDFTSIQERIQTLQEQKVAQSKQTINQSAQPATLMPFVSNPKDTKSKIPFKLSDYLELVDYTGRSLRGDKRGHLPNNLLPILESLKLTPQGWLGLTKNIEKDFSYAVGHANNLTQFSQSHRTRPPKGISLARIHYQHQAVA